jgi:hypothetical protein
MVTDRLLPRLSLAIGHPFDSCRDHISRCLFRICYTHRKRVRIGASRGENPLGNETSKDDPGSIVVAKLRSLEKVDGWSFNNRYNALSTARRFVSYCVHLGEAKHERNIVPLYRSYLKPSSRQSRMKFVIPLNVLRRKMQPSCSRGRRDVSVHDRGTQYSIISTVVKHIRVLDVVGTYKHSSWQVRRERKFLRSSGA